MEMDHTMSLYDCLKEQQEVMAVLSNNDHNINSVKQLQAIWREIKTIRDSQQKQIKKLIRAWQDHEQDEAGKTSCGEEAAQLLSHEESIQGQIILAKQALGGAKEEFEDVQQKVDRSRTELDQLVQERDRVQKQTTQSLPKARYDVNLYMNMTNIRWQFDCEPDEVKGFVCNKNDVKPFSLNSKQVSKFFIANYLWDLIEEDW